MAQANDIAIDLGTSNVVIYMKGRGIVFREPSVVAVDRETQNIIAFGMEAYRMIGRTPANVNVVRPLAILRYRQAHPGQAEGGYGRAHRH